MTREKMDLTGQKYGRLTVLSEAPKKGRQRYWTCQCDCGTVKNVQHAHLRNGSIVSCGCKRKEYEDLTGRVFGRLTVIKVGKYVINDYENEDYPYLNKIGVRYWICQCECGEITEVSSISLKNEYTRSCGCLRVDSGIKNIMNYNQHQHQRKKKIKYLKGMRYGHYEIIYSTEFPDRRWCKCVLCGHQTLLYITKLSKLPKCEKAKYHKKLSKNIDLTGLTFNQLTVLEKCIDRKNANYWLCKCRCGNEKTVRQDHLVHDKVKSCGCLRNVKKPKVDLSGKKFGRLTAVSPTDQRKHGHTVWLCECDCGNQCYVESVYLTSGQTKSCGCLKKYIENFNLREKLEEQRVEGVNTSLLKAKIRTDNKSGAKGVYYHKATGKWYAQLVVGGKSYRSSTYQNKDDAIRARKELEEKYHKPYLEAKQNDDA